MPIIKLKDLKPKEHNYIYDLVRAAGISTVAWERDNNGEPRRNPQNTPHLAQRWSFLEDAPKGILLLCLWHEELHLDQGGIYATRNMQELTNANGNNKNNARRMGRDIQTAIDEKFKTIRVIIKDKETNYSTLDDAKWSIGDPAESGDFRIQREKSQSRTQTNNKSHTSDTTFQFRPGEPSGAYETIAQPSSLGEREIKLRHNELQKLLYQQLLAKGINSECIGPEILIGDNKRIDIVIKHDAGFDFFETKTSESARECIREALPQLLEYSYWPGNVRAHKLYISATPELDPASKQYLEALNTEFSIPIEYWRIA